MAGFDVSGINFGDSKQRQSANDMLKSYVGGLNPGGFNTDSVLRGFAGIAEMGRSDDNTFRNTLWGAVNPGTVMDNNFLSDPNHLASYRSGFDAFNKYKAGDTASLQEALKQVESQKQTLPVAQGGYMQPPAPSSNGFTAQPATGGAMGGLMGSGTNTGGTQNNAYTPTMNGNKAVAPGGFQQQDYEAVARMGGYTGEMGGGAHQAWIDADPTGQRQQQWNQALQGYMQQNGNAAGEVAGGGVEVLGKNASLNDWQKAGLERLNAGPGQDYAGNTADALAAYRAGIMNPTANINSYMNPFQDYMTGEVNKQYDALNNAVRARAARMGNSGASSEAIQQSENDKNRVSTIGQLMAGNWNNAVAAGSANNAGNLNLGNAYTSLDDYINKRYYDQARTSLGAGGVIQDQHQRELDATQAELERQRNYPYSSLEFLKGILGAYPTGSNNTTTTPGNMLGGAVGGGLLGNYLSTSGLLTGKYNYNDTPGAPLPWRQ